VADLLRDYPARTLATEHGDLLLGLQGRLHLHRRGELGEVVGDLDLGETARFYPCDEAISRWQRSADGVLAQVIYDLSAG
jgi:DNA polymerase-3 subunit alpha